jgi:hypothetical protein
LNEWHFSWSKWLPILISGTALVVSAIALYSNIIFERARSKAQIEVWQRNTFYAGGNDERTKITLLFRNLNHRPTAIVDIYIRQDEGIIGGRGYHDRIALPIQVDPWGVKEVEFRIEQSDEKQMNNVFVRDIEDNEIIVIRGTGRNWTKTKSK